MKSNEREYNLGNIRLLIVAILWVVSSTLSQGCQVFSDRQATDTHSRASQNADTGEILTGCQENVIDNDLTLNQCGYEPEPPTVIDLTREKSARKVHYIKNNP